MEDVVDVEVYDFPSIYGGDHRITNDMLIIGIHSAIRNAMEISGRWDDPNSMVIVEHAGSQAAVKVVLIDALFMDEGGRPADHTARHCWMTDAARQKLGLKEICFECRAHNQAFTSKFSPVTIKGSRLLFSYGSNGKNQLRGRIGRAVHAAFESHPASLAGYTRIFCGHSDKWGGSFASLHSCKGGVTYGHVVELTREEFALLDGFEGGYARQKLILTLQSGLAVQAWTYISHNHACESPPSAAYLTAIHIMLREHFGGDIAIDRLCVGPDGNLKAHCFVLPTIFPSDTSSGNRHPLETPRQLCTGSVFSHG